MKPIIDIFTENHLKYQSTQFHAMDDLLDAANMYRHNTSMGSEWTFGVYGNLKISEHHLRRGSLYPSLENTYEEKKNKFYDTHPDISNIRTSANKKTRVKTFADNGDEIDIDRYNEGNENHWRSRKHAYSKKAVKMWLNASIAARQSSDIHIANVLYLSTVIEALQTHGVSVELHVGMMTKLDKSGVDYHFITVPLKLADEPLDIGRVLSVAAPAFLRYYLFNVIENYTHKFNDLELGSVCGENEMYTPIRDKFDYNIILAGQLEESSPFAIINDVKNIINIEI